MYQLTDTGNRYRSGTWSGIGGSLLAASQGHITGREKAATSGSCIPDPALSPDPPPENKPDDDQGEIGEQ